LHKIFLKIKNIGKKNTPNLFYLKCISSPNEIKGKTVPINFILKPSMIINLEISLEISNLNSGIYFSAWRLQNTQGEFFGEEIFLKIKIENDKIIISPNKINEIVNNDNNMENEKGNDKENEGVSSRIISLEEFRKLKIIKKNRLEKKE
jgi:hypothetical protein